MTKYEALGFQGENKWKPVEISIAELTAKHAGGLATMLVVRPGETEGYVPENVVQDGNKVVWTPTDYDTQNNGIIKAQVLYTVNGDLIGKTDIKCYEVKRSLSASEEAPPDLDNWINELVEAAGEVQEAINAYDAMTSEAEGLPYGNNPTSEIDHTGDHPVLKLGIPDGKPGDPGLDGFSPTVTIEDITGGHRITITDKNGSHVADVMDGEQGDPGQPGRGIVSIEKTSTSGNVDTYTITYTSGNPSTFTVTNGTDGNDGVGIQSITKTGSSGGVDTYTILYTDGNSTTFTVTNANIDDNAGVGDSTKVWSADKSATELASVNSALPLTQLDMVTASGHDLNSYITPSSFFAQAGISHAPTSVQNYVIFNYYAKWNGGVRYWLISIAIGTADGKTYTRTYESNGQTWSSWMPLNFDVSQIGSGSITRAMLSSAYQTAQTDALSSSDDLNDYISPDVLFALSSAAHVPNSTYNYHVVVDVGLWQSGTRKIIKQTAVTDAGLVYVRTATTSNNVTTWGNWHKITLSSEITALSNSISFVRDEAESAVRDLFSLLSSELTEGFLKTDGTVKDNSLYYTTDYVPVKSGKLFKYRLSHGTTLPIVCFYTTPDISGFDSTKTVTGINGYSESTFTPTSDGYVRFTWIKSKADTWVIFNENVPENVKKYAFTDVLKNLNILCLGDSIFGNDGEIVNNINQLSAATAINGAFGGSRVSDRGGSDNFQYFDGVNLVNALCSQTWTDQDAAALALSSTYPWVADRLAALKAVDMSKVDLITMDWGTNDYTAGATIEQISSAYNTVIDLIQETYPSIRILIITPIWRYFGAKTDNENGDNKVYNVSTLKQIAAAIDENSKDKRIESLQMYQKMPLSYNTADLYFDANDSTHLNATGNLVYAHILIGKMRTMY